MKDNQCQHIIWDWNGTLVNDAWLFVELMNEELDVRNLPLIDVEAYREHFTFPVKKYYENLGFNFERENFQEVGYNFIQKYKRRQHEPLLFEETIEILTKISRLGISQSIISAQEDKLLQKSVIHYKLTNFFESIMGIDHYYADSKFKIAEANKKQLSCNSNSIMMVGDTAHDYEVASALGVNCILFANGHYSRARLEQVHCKIIHNLLDLLNYI